jgi:hypothetical protein
VICNSAIAFLEQEFDMNKNIGTTLPKDAGAMQTEILSRRDVLRGALAVGCSLFATSALFSSSAIAADAAAATTKIAKKSVQYQEKPKGEQKCGGCTNFIAASKTCKRVEGPINPDGWCMLWAKKA